MSEMPEHLCAETDIERARRDGFDEGYHQGQLEMLVKQRAVFSERNKLVCALSKLFPAHLGRHTDESIPCAANCRTIVYVQIPAGQVSWHILDSELWMFVGLLYKEGTWDGHTTEEKYIRLASLPRPNKDSIMS